MLITWRFLLHLSFEIGRMDVVAKMSDLFRSLKDLSVEKQEETLTLLEAHTDTLKKSIHSAKSGLAEVSPLAAADEVKEQNAADQIVEQQNAAQVPRRSKRKGNAIIGGNDVICTKPAPKATTKAEPVESLTARPRRSARQAAAKAVIDTVIKEEVSGDSEWSPAGSGHQSPRKQHKGEKVPAQGDVPEGIKSEVSCDQADTDNGANAEQCVLGKSADDEKVITKVVKKQRKAANKQAREKLTCEVCQKVLSSAQVLQQHMRIHTGAMPYKCTLCDKSFRQMAGLGTHKKIYHNESGEMHKCTESKECDFAAPYLYMVKDHIRRVHIQSRDYLCSNCGKGFISKKALRSHEQVHMPSKRLKCPQCDFRTHSDSCLQTHKRNVHSETHKVYICEICGAKLKYHGTYKDHLRRHYGEKPYKCEICKAAFVSSSQQMSHMRLHKPRTEQCKSCSKKFLTKDHLRRHSLIHSGDKPFKCPSCDYSCNVQYNLRKHCLAKHNIIYPPMCKQYVLKLADIGTEGAKQTGQQTRSEARRSKRQKEISELCDKLGGLPETLQTSVGDDTAAELETQHATAAQIEVDKLCKTLNLQSASGLEKDCVTVTLAGMVNKVEPTFDMQAKEGCQLHASTGQELNFEVLELSSSQVVKLEPETAGSGQVMYIVEGGGQNNACVVTERHLPEVVDHEEVAQIVRVVDHHSVGSNQADALQGSEYIVAHEYGQVPNQ